MKLLKYGDTVTVSGKYVRVCKSVQTGLSSNLHKEWVFKQGEITGIYLGVRTLANGRVEYDPEYPTEFVPLEHFKAALISPSERLNPVYTPFPKGMGIVVRKGTSEVRRCD